MSDITIFENAQLFDGHSNYLIENASVTIEGLRIREISDKPPKSSSALRIDLTGRTLMPGLIDAHFHAYATEIDLGYAHAKPRSLHALEARALLEAALLRGFTTIRDAAGADYGLARATELGLINGPRLFYSGRAISQTGGHGDFRGPDSECSHFCGCGSSSFAWVANGVEEVRAAVREELRKGATQIKIFASGGISSPSDPIWMLQYSEAEIRAAVEEAQSRRSYVLAHAYTPESITRAVRSGVRSIEHGNLIDKDTACFVRQQGAFVVPTLVTYDALYAQGRAQGAPAYLLEKLDEVRLAGLRALTILQDCDVDIGFGTDLLGQLHELQSDEFLIRARVMKPIDILKSATSVNARLLQREGELGIIAPGAIADLIVVDGNPIEDLALLTGQGNHISVIMQSGKFIKNTSSAAS